MSGSTQEHVTTNAAGQYGSLPDASYTAKRLNDATPEHLHETSRRCFIGPIPAGWIDSHRKSWFTTKVKRNYRLSSATFTASENTSRQRRTSGLNEDHSPVHASFPRPEDIDDDQNIATLDVGRDTSRRGHASTPEAETTGSRRSLGDDDGGSGTNHTGSPKRGSPLNTAHLEILPRNSDDNRLSSSGDRRLSQQGSTVGASSLAPDNQPMDTTSSTTSLLRGKDSIKDGVDRNGEDDASQPNGSLAETSDPVRKARVTKAASAGGAALREPNGHIRFDEENEGLRSTLMLRARMGQSYIRNGIGGVLGRRMADGAILKMEKMLVRIDATATTKLPTEYDENSSQGIVSTTKEEWREYMIVVRQKRSKKGIEYVLQAYKSRVIPASERGQSKKPQFEILLQAKVSHLNMYSSLDKTLVLWTSDSRGTTIYILQARAISSSVEWLTFLRGVYGLRRPSELTVSIPEIDISLRLEDPFDTLNPAEDLSDVDEAGDDFAVEAACKEEAIAPSLVHRCLDMLNASPETSNTLDKWQHGQRLGLAWKRYDRLEWIHGVQEKKMFGTIAMIQSHDLELRPKEHYPTLATTKKGKVLREPAPVEGFLIQLTSQKGQRRNMGRNFFNRLYFASFDQFLIFTQPKRAIPPAPPEDTVIDQSVSAKKLSQQMPLIYAVNPFPVVGGSLRWLDTGESSGPKSMDERAQQESARKTEMFKDCDGFINLCDVVKVRKVHHDDDEVLVHTEADSEPDSEQDTPEHDEGQMTADDSKTFELVLRNGLVMRLRAFDKQTKKEWKKRLRALVKYWRWRHAEDIQLFHHVRKRNLHELQVDEEGEAHVGQFARKWELNQTYASPIMYNMCGISGCRTIHLSGALYTKPRLHGHFALNHCILISGHLLLFESSLRASTGQIVRHTHHMRKQVIDLRDAYLYSGLLTESDLLYHNTTFDANSPGHHALPRMWTEDGWDNWDEDIMTCFALWKPAGKSWFRDESQSSGTRLKRVSALGKKGNKIVFRARSRAERDRWVLALAAEMEKQENREEVRVVGAPVPR